MSGKVVVHFALVCLFYLWLGGVWFFNSKSLYQVMPTISVGSKPFTENRLLAEIMAQLIEDRMDIAVVRRTNLGGTNIIFAALEEGEIDLYAEYTGTAWAAILQRSERETDPLRTFLVVAHEFEQKYQSKWLNPFGFDNTYAVAVLEETSRRLNLLRISDLGMHGDELRAGWSHEFAGREDGLPGLQTTYGLAISNSRNMEHGLAYEALRNGEIDLTDAYSTDGKLLRFPVRILEDDRNFFPPYDCAPVVRRDTLGRYPKLEETLSDLACRISDQTMQRLNYQVEEEGLAPEVVAREYLIELGLLQQSLEDEDVKTNQGFLAKQVDTLLALTLQHLYLSLVSVLLAVLVALPLGILLSRHSGFAAPVLGLTGIVQTIPGLALLAFMIPIPGLGLSVRSALAALFLYALLPIVRNTYTGIRDVDADLVRAASGMGLLPRQVLWLVQLPLATPAIMAGIRTAAVISVGMTTLAAFIGAGGLGEPILTGLQMNDTRLIMAGAIPAALLALIVDGVLAMVEQRLSPDLGER